MIVVYLHMKAEGTLIIFLWLSISTPDPDKLLFLVHPR